MCNARRTLFHNGIILISSLEQTDTGRGSSELKSGRSRLHNECWIYEYFFGSTFGSTYLHQSPEEALIN